MGWGGCVEQSHHAMSGLKTVLRSGEQPALSPAICIRREGGCWDSVLLGLRLGSCLNKLRFEIRVNAGERAALSMQQQRRDILTAHDKWVKMGPGVLKISC